MPNITSILCVNCVHLFWSTTPIVLCCSNKWSLGYMGRLEFMYTDMW